MEVPMLRTRTGSSSGLVGALFDRAPLLPSLRRQSRPQPADIPLVKHGSDSRSRPASARGRTGAAIVSHPYLLIPTVAIALAGMLLLLHAHADLLRAAFGVPNTTKVGGGAASTNAQGLFHHVQSLSTDALYVLMPSVTLAGAVGGIAWAAGSRRGPSIVGGAIVAGVVGAALNVIVT